MQYIFLVIIITSAALGLGGIPRGGPVPLEDCEFLDLSWPFDRDTVYWPGAPNFKLDPFGHNEDPYYRANNFSAAEHGGTHLDAPNHFASRTFNVDQLPINQLIGQACVIDVTQQVSGNPDYEVTIKDIQDFEVEHAPVDECILVLRTGWEAHYSNKRRYLGASAVDKGDASDLHFPGLSPSAAQWLSENRNIKGVGIDTASIDYGQSKNFEAHKYLSARNIYNLENMMNLHRLPSRGATLIVAPMKIAGGSGAPVRIFGFGLDYEDPCRRRPALNGCA